MRVQRDYYRPSQDKAHNVPQFDLHRCPMEITQLRTKLGGAASFWGVYETPGSSGFRVDMKKGGLFGPAFIVVLAAPAQCYVEQRMEQNPPQSANFNRGGEI